MPANALVRTEHHPMNDRSGENNGGTRENRRDRADQTDSEMHNRQKPPEQFHSRATAKFLIPAVVDLILSFPRLNSNRRIVYATCSWNQSARLHLIDKTGDGPKQIRLSDNFGKGNTLLLFFPMAFTGKCTTEMCEVSAGLNGYTNLNAAVYGISGDNPFAQEAWAQKEKITVPLLSDYDHNVAKQYGVMYDSFL